MQLLHQENNDRRPQMPFDDGSRNDWLQAYIYGSTKKQPLRQRA